MENGRFVNGTIGPHEIGVLASVFVFGLVTSQVSTYFRKYPNDKKAMKRLVRIHFAVLHYAVSDMIYCRLLLYSKNKLNT